MALIKVDTSKVERKIKPMHAGGQPPLGGKGYNQYFHFLTEAGIPYSRLHDVGGAFGGSRFVDIPNVFRNFDADENDPKSYDFTFTDFLIKSLMDAGVEPYYRLGITIENQSYIKTYHTDPPKDYDKWARICEHIIAHYTEGWADGFNYDITYWEIWNEPDNINIEPSELWSGTPEEFYRLYDVAAKHLKKRFPKIKVGGYSSWGFTALTAENPTEKHKYFLDFFINFLEYVREHKSPIDFFSWHSYYRSNVTVIWDKFVKEKLVEYGLGNIESHLTEWLPLVGQHGTAAQSAEIVATMIELQKGYTDICCIYDMRLTSGLYGTFFDPKQKLSQAYYDMVAFNTLYKLGDQVEATSDDEKLHVLAASNGKKNALLVSNLNEATLPLTIEGIDLENARISIIDDKRLLSWAHNAKEIEPNAVMLIEW